MRKWLSDNIVILIGGVILFLVFLAVLAPIAAYFGIDWIAKPIYFIYQFLCHQRPWRSIHVLDHQFAFCTRDTFIYLSLGLSAFIVQWKKLRPLKWYWAIVLTIPIAVDGLTQTAGEFYSIQTNNPVFFYASTNFLRALTGSLFGSGVGFLIFGILYDTLQEETGKKLKKQSWKIPLLYSLGLSAVLVIIYIVVVQIWQLTSPTYGPNGWLDHVRLFPGVNYEVVERAGHGCPSPGCGL